MFKVVNMHEVRNDCLIMYSLSEVVLEKANLYYLDYINTPGTVYLTEYLDTRERFFEWKPTIFNVRLEEDWNVISSVEGGSQHQKYIRINLRDIKQYWISNEKDKFKVMGEKDDAFCTLSTKKKTFSILYEAMNSLFISKTFDGQAHLHNVEKVFEESSDIYRTFLNLEMFLDNELASIFWEIIREFQKSTFSPIETCMAKIGFSCDVEDESSPEPVDPSAPAQIDATQLHIAYCEPYIIKSKPFSFNEFSNSCINPDLVRQRVLEGGVIPQCRPVLWKYLLGYYNWTTTRHERKRVDENRNSRYAHMKCQWIAMSDQDYKNSKDLSSRMTSVSRELNRYNSILSQVVSLPYNKISAILKTLVIYNHDIRYLYGFTELLVPLVYVANSEFECFWLLAYFTEKYMINFNLEDTDLRHQLRDLYTLLMILDPEYADYFKEKKCEHMYFCLRWFWLCFVKEFTDKQILKLWELLFLDLPCTNFHLLVAVAILNSQKIYIIRNDLDFLGILKHMNTLKGSLNVDLIMEEARNMHFKLVEIFKNPHNVRTIKNLNLVELNDSTESIIRDLIAAHIDNRSHIVE